jgi:hypothetical protein
VSTALWCSPRLKRFSLARDSVFGLGETASREPIRMVAEG